MISNKKIQFKQYYYAYYLLSKFAQRFNNRDGDYAFTTIFYLFLLNGLNVLTLLLLLYDKAYFSSHIIMMVFVSAIVPATIHYFGLVRNKKYLEIIEEYDEKLRGRSLNKAAIVILLIYILLTFVSVIYIANIIRSQSI